MRVKMDQAVRWDDGTIASPREMLDRGLGEIRIVSNFVGARGKPRRAIFVDRIGTQCGVEISSFVAK